MTSQSASGEPKHRSVRRRWWQQRSELPVPVPEPVWAPEWAADWQVVTPQAESVADPAD
jgi:hypothetical protein